MKDFGGNVLYLDRCDINTDEIIPARYLTEATKEALAPYLLEDLNIEGFDPKSDALKKSDVIVTRENFGCGSSREHAPWALEVNHITVVVAQSYARIFRQNMFNCGMLAIELPKDELDRVFALADKAPVRCDVDLDGKRFTFTADGGHALEVDFVLPEFDEALVRAGGWVEYADANY